MIGSMFEKLERALAASEKRAEAWKVAALAGNELASVEYHDEDCDWHMTCCDCSCVFWPLVSAVLDTINAARKLEAEKEQDAK